ncbi:hypothetical protein COO91_01616 [Nostoc flagelliforme CCNUN1]|uniref:Uncharacterized protein n=1 Tax=Nostoc flagelliforme CCNUN1 TaxID=2038116 RepID=A0A2K8SJR1_9NOSO|nr:hypothetical protein [Nostoc flagelliforme]AUB35726.1 hypothetical protein COO91_01616 [Nostoc flagelliforme CCNUN1]
MISQAKTSVVPIADLGDMLSADITKFVTNSRAIATTTQQFIL